MGDPVDPATDVGPLIDATTCRETETLIGQAGRDGLLVAGGECLGGALSGGYFIAPALIREPPLAGGAASMDVGGPVLLMTRFGSDDEALAMVNRGTTGFHGGVYTSDLSRTHRFAAGLSSGSITVNESESWSAAGAGRAGLMEFLRIKNVFVDLSV